MGCNSFLSFSLSAIYSGVRREGRNEKKGGGRGKGRSGKKLAVRSVLHHPLLSADMGREEGGEGGKKGRRGGGDGWPGSRASVLPPLRS